MPNPINQNQQLLTSILDRLLDDEPDNQHDSPKTANEVLRELRLSVRRDLENLLNTRWRCVSWPPDLDDLEVSLVNYGIPDFCGGNLGADAPTQLMNIIQTTIKNFEPRLRNVRVSLLDKTPRIDRTLQFRIEAVLFVDPVEDRVSFDSALEIATGDLRIQGCGR
jgi:type VI secretion system protein ImpF